MKLQKSLSNCLFLSIFFLSTFGQTTQTTSQSASRQEEKAKQEQLAFETLDEILAGANALKLPENRLRIKTMAAGILWEKDQKRARSFFQEAENELKQMIQSLSQETEDIQRKVDTVTNFRNEIIRSLSQIDPQLALELFQNTRIPNELKRPNFGGYDPEVQFEADLSIRAAGRDPAKAIKMAEEILKKGYSYQLMNLAQNFQSNEATRSTATEIYQMIINKLASDDLLSSTEGAGIAGGLLQRANAEYQIRNNPAAANSSRPIVPTLDEQMVRQLVETLAKATTRNTTDPVALNNANQLRSQLQSMQSLVEKYAPTYLPNLKGKASPNTAANQPVGISNSYNEYSILAGNPATTTEQLIEFAKKTPPQEQNNIFQQIAMREAQRGDATKAKQIADEYLKSPSAKENFDRALESITVNKAAQTGNIEATKLAIASIRSPQRKAEQLIFLAERVSSKGDKKAAESILEEALTFLGNPPETYSQIYPLVNLSRVYAPISIDRSCEILNSMAGKLNVVIAAASVIDGFEQRNAFQAGEARISGGFSALQSLQNMNSTLSYIATIDFEKAKAVANNFDRNEIRLSALLSVVSGVIRPPARNSAMSRGIAPLPPPPPAPIRE